MNKDYALGILVGFVFAQPSVPDVVRDAIEFLEESDHPISLSGTISGRYQSKEPNFTEVDTKTDEEKVAEYLTRNPIEPTKKERKSNSMSPENRAAAAVRMAAMQARKKAEREAQNGNHKNIIEEMPEPKVNPVGNGHTPVEKEAGDTEVETSSEKQFDLDTGLEIDPKTGALKLF